MFSIFGPASPETQVKPLLEAQEKQLDSKIPDVLKDQKPKESPTQLFQSFLDTGNSMFQDAAHNALNRLSMFADKAQTFAAEFPDKVDKVMGVTRFDRTEHAHAQEGVAPQHIASIAFSENGLPTASLTDGRMAPIDALPLAYEAQPLSSLTYTIPQGKKEGQPVYEKVTITDPQKLAVAGQVKSIVENIRPEYTNYLLKLANNEGQLNPQARLYNFKDGTSSNNPADAHQHGGIDSVDRGLYQINSKAFPQITDEMADNPELATLWAISLIDAGKQSKWMANQKTRDTRVTYE